jgi:hypothetical protein
MEPEGTSRDDLDVRLNWPGAGPAGSADLFSVEHNNDAPVEPSPSKRRDAPTNAQGQGVAASITPTPNPPLTIEAAELQAALDSISERLDALASSSNARQSAAEDTITERPLAAALERLQRSITALTESTALSEERIGASLREIAEEVQRVASGQAELRQRTNEITHQMDTLRRRITLRARADYALSPEVIQLIADAVAERLSASASSPRKTERSGSAQDARRR